jgi:hypothetical protein
MAKASIARWAHRTVRALILVAMATLAFEGTALAQFNTTLTVTPPVVGAGQPVVATYVIRNEDTADFVLPLIVSLVAPDGTVLEERSDTANLPGGAVYTNMQTFATAGLAPGTYQVTLDTTLEGGLRLGTATFEVVAATLDCTAAGPTVDELWPPNHKFVGVSITGVTDAAGNPAEITITEVFQDEPVNSVGDGNTCPDATGLGRSEVRVRSERSGTLDGRIYHLRFTATDPTGGSCAGVVKVCVPHDQGRKPQCIDQGPIFNSGLCPTTPRLPKNK